ncbi:MAG TPA: response regulator [Burkholderiales bacterium]|jgi:CheY-like chemotaxis protein|nr:response regulator [Burkholderiales bacterium]
MPKAVIPLKRILQIDDDEDILIVGQTALQGYGGFEVRIAQSGGEALEVARSFTPQLILLDWMMPGMDGLATLQALHQAPALVQVPVVYLTAAVSPGLREAALAAGAVEVLIKPFVPRRLVADLNQIWARCAASAA